MVSSSHMKVLKKAMHGSNDDDKVNESEEFECKHYLFGSFCFTGVSGSRVTPSLACLASYSLWYLPWLPFPTFFISLGISNVVLACPQYKLPVRGMRTPETGMKHIQFYSNNLLSE